MRLIVYTSFLILCGFLITSTEAENRNLKKSKDIGGDSDEKYTKYKKEKKYSRYKYRNDDSNEKEGNKINRPTKEKCRGKGCDKVETGEYDEDVDDFKEKYLKYTKRFNKHKDDSIEDPIYTRSKNRKVDLGKERSYEFNKIYKKNVASEESEEDQEEVMAKDRKIKDSEPEDKKLKRSYKKTGDSASKDRERKKENSRKRTRKVAEDSDENDSVEGFKFKTNKNPTRNNKQFLNDDSAEDFQATKSKGKIKKEIRRERFTAIDSSEEDNIQSEASDESDESEEELQTCRKKRNERNCPTKTFKKYDDSAESDETSKESVNERKIKYSIKFAHEKQKNVPNDEDNIMKIHREKKKYKYEDDDENDDSSEEQGHPKRIRYADDDEE